MQKYLLKVCFLSQFDMYFIFYVIFEHNIIKYFQPLIIMKIYFTTLVLLLLAIFNFNIVHATQPQNVTTTIFSILSYVNLENSSPLICTINNSSLADQLIKKAPPQNKYRLKNISNNDLKKNNCNVIIFSTFSPREEQTILNLYSNTPVLSISTNNAQCEEGSAICLYRKKNQISFKINLESVNQSKVSIDPRVLLLAKEAE
ncbi:hypothetical protein B9T31_14290 [Acinetobacter sp. ANC 4558]|uniref:YfiR family protein n=1 Tax=Acinetobacter sp. ANC 4558 TaxID=1977876 RepID=UPI000A3303FF|nr:YfiR family protein [Acinetobacter sp. ANC 4558]OTG83250.1 hypothetical protein B9T31_14290 [Acinetobacter sp. ANC 4558]